MKRKNVSDAMVLEDEGVAIRQIIWLPGAGLGMALMPPAMEALLADLYAPEKPPIVATLPILEQFTLLENADEDQLCAALEGTPGFIIQCETPKRKWFSDGSPRMNWGENWTEWFYVTDVSAFVPTAIRFVRDCIDRDEALHPRIFENTSVECD